MELTSLSLLQLLGEGGGGGGGGGGTDGRKEEGGTERWTDRRTAGKILDLSLKTILSSNISYHHRYFPLCARQLISKLTSQRSVVIPERKEKSLRYL